MKKVFMMLLVAAAMCGCGGQMGNSNKAQSDSIAALTMENEQLRNEQDELLTTLNEIEDGFREISEAQGRMTIDRRGEGEDARERIRENMQYIQQTMAQNAELIEKLRAQMRDSGRKNDKLQHTIENLMAQMEQKNAELEQLRRELEAKNIHIAELDEQVASLNQNVDELTQQNQQQDETISQQDRQINAAWYAIGTKKELKAHNILNKGDVLHGDFDASYFTQIDIRHVIEIPLHSKSADILTNHPVGSYRLERDENKLYTLIISDANQFWSTSKYLVVQVK